MHSTMTAFPQSLF